MAKQLFSNNAKGRLNAGITSGALTLTLQAGQGALFPSPSGGDYFLATIVDTSGNKEIVKCTARSTDTLTVVRAQESTTNRAFSANDIVEARWTAGSAELLRDYLWAESGTRMVFHQTASPTFWTKETDSAYDNVGLRVVVGPVSNGGADDFSSVFGSSKTTDGHSITQAELPVCSFTVIDPGHLHTNTPGGSGQTGGAGSGTGLIVYAGSQNSDVKTTGITVSSGGSDTAHTHPLTMDLKFYDVIIAEKD